MGFQLSFSLALCLIPISEGLHASGADLSNLISISCNDSEDLRGVEVTITQQNFSRLNLTSPKELRLLDNNCKPVPYHGGTWKWNFSEKSLCGGQLNVQTQDEFEIVTLGNMVIKTCISEIQLDSL
jgi:hypothetical protein